MTYLVTPELQLNIRGNDYTLSPALECIKKIQHHFKQDILVTIEKMPAMDFEQHAKIIEIAIDDFGAENSNLSRLIEISPDYLKIDGQFIRNIVDDKNSQIIVDGIISICKKCDIKIIAEYVHNEAVQKKIQELGIEYSQGYYFGEPRADLIEE